jgi:hypothetical protein
MAGPAMLIFFALQTIVYFGFVSRSPLNFETTAPTQSWADTPMRLVHTPQYETKKVIATQRRDQGGRPADLRW